MRRNNALRSTRPKAGVAALLVTLLAATAAGCDDGRAAASDESGASVKFAAPVDGAHIAGSIVVKMEADGVTIEPAGEVKPDAGHFHVLVDNECLAAGAAIPKDRGHRHFGKGQTEAKLALPSGEHTLCLQVGDGVHVATSLTDQVTVTVGVTNLDEWCGVMREAGATIEANPIEGPLEEIQPAQADVLALIDQLIVGSEFIDDGHRDDVLKLIQAQQQLSQIVVDATDEAAMRAEIAEVSSQEVAVAERTFEWVGTTCGLFEDEEAEDAAPEASGGGPAVEATSHGDVRTIVDQSPTVSDIGALGFLAARSDVELIAVTMPSTGEADCAPGAISTRAVLDAAGQSDVPIGCGGDPLEGINEWPLEWQNSADTLAEIVAPGATEPTYYDAESILLEELGSASEPITIVALGPLTNIAAVLETDPSLGDKIERIVIMGGAVSVPGNVEPDLSAEWNLHADPGAAKAVIESGVPVSLVALDATNQVPLTPEYISGVGSIDNALAAVEAAALGTLAGLDYWFMWDELAAVLTVQPEVATWNEQLIVVEADGSTVESPEGTPVRVAVDADATSVYSLVLGAFGELGS